MAKIKRLHERRERYEGYWAQMAEKGERQLSLTDPDSRSMPKSPKAPVAYNVQTAVDSKHHLIVAQEVTNEVVDRNLLYATAQEAKETLGVDRIKAVADMGYSNGKELKACLEAGIEPYVPRPNPSANHKLGLFGKKKFSYDRETDSYQCPAGETLSFRREVEEKGRRIRYYYQTGVCATCPLKAKCTRNKRYRRLTRWVDEHILEETEQRVKAHPEIMQQRKALVEHPFGTIKHWWDQGHFLMRGLAKVRAEFSLSALAYNIRRVLNILGCAHLVALLKSEVRAARGGLKPAQNLFFNASKRLLGRSLR